MFLVLHFGAYGQNQELADSLEKIYLQGNFKVSDQLKILSAVATIIRIQISPLYTAKSFSKRLR
jgi:hypothetical protein